LSDKAIRDLFASLRASRSRAGNNIFRHDRERSGTARWSAICFTYESTPFFLRSASNVKERLCGYLMLVEYEGDAAIFSSRSRSRQPFGRDT
jgi:hypothetical protein